MVKELDVKRLMDNILILISAKKLKISDVENEIGISTGYLSKMIKKGESANPSMEIVWKLANYFDVSVERLVDGDVTDPHDNLSLLIATMNFCRANTISGVMKWSPITVEDINEQLHAEKPTIPIIGYRKRCVPTQEPYPDKIPSGVSESCYGDNAVRSRLAPNVRIYAVGSAYKGHFTENSWFHIYKLGGCLQPIQTDTSENNEPTFTVFYDVWLEDADDEALGFKYLCTTRAADLQLRESIDQLYQTIDSARTDVVLDPKVRDLLKTVVGGNQT